MTGSMLANHLWQSTLCVGAAWVLTLALRRNRASVRHAVWLAASLKFLIPFGLLVSAGGRFAWRHAIVEPSMPYTVVADIVGQPFSQTFIRVMRQSASQTALEAIGRALPAALVAVWAVGAFVLLVTWMVRWHRVAAVVRSAAHVDSGPIFDILWRLERETDVKRQIALVSSRSSFEPGVFGILTPVLVWPDQISAHLSPAQIEAIVAHEITHVRRRDNLAATLHMLVQAAFWFHPVVWWIGSRLVDERERACDEAVVRAGNEPQSYAEGILKVCQFYAESPLTCVAGVTGSDLKKRIERIMTNDARGTLDAWKKCLLAAAVVAAIAGPVLVGALNAPLRAQSADDTRRDLQRELDGLIDHAHAAEPTALLRARAQTSAAVKPAFDVTSVKPNSSGDDGVSMSPTPGGITITNATLQMMMRLAYRVQDSQIIGGPSWLSTARFDVTARAQVNVRQQDLSPMLRALLVDRFMLGVHDETRVLPVYALIKARSDAKFGPALRTPSDCVRLLDRQLTPPQSVSVASLPLCGNKVLPGEMSSRGVTMLTLAVNLSVFTGRTVVDRTGFAETFDYDLTWTPDVVIQGQADSNHPSLFTALQEQLGLKLESTKGPVKVLVIDRAEKPTAD